MFLSTHLLSTSVPKDAHAAYTLDRCRAEAGPWAGLGEQPQDEGQGGVGAEKWVGLEEVPLTPAAVWVTSRPTGGPCPRRGLGTDPQPPSSQEQPPSWGGPPDPSCRSCDIREGRGGFLRGPCMHPSHAHPHPAPPPKACLGSTAPGEKEAHCPHRLLTLGSRPPCICFPALRAF